MLWRYLGAAFGAVATVAAGRYGALGGTVAAAATTVTSATEALLGAYLPAEIALIAGASTSAAGAALLALAVQVTDAVRRILSAITVLLAVAVIVGMQGDTQVPVAAFALLAAAALMNFVAGPLLITPISAISASLIAGTLISLPALHGQTTTLEGWIASALATGTSLLAGALLLRR